MRLHSINLDVPGAFQRVRAMLTSQPDFMDLLAQLANLEIQISTAASRSDAPVTIAVARRLAGGSLNPELDRLEALTLGSEAMASGDRSKTGAAIQAVLRGEEKAAALRAN